MDGEMWEMPKEPEDEEENVEDDMEISVQEPPRIKPSGVNGCRNMAICFKNGQRINHTIGITKIWIGTYDSSNNKIVCDGISYDSLSCFALTHRRIYKVRKTANGWAECKCEVDGKWISTVDLPC